jgi:mannan endo-1,4-beta-mannosidase
MQTVNKNATKEAKELLNYLHSVMGKRIITGQHTQTNPQEELQLIWEQTNKLPALCGFELLAYSPNINYEDMTAECKREVVEARDTVKKAYEWAINKGGIVSFCWHWYSPVGGHDKSFYTKNTDFDPLNILQEGTVERTKFYEDMDKIAEILKGFLDKNIPILWRPFHEVEGTWFWWGSQGGEVAAKLYRLMYQYFVEEKKLNHLIWVWSTPTKEAYPGDDYVDIVAWDIYVEKHEKTDYGKQFSELVSNTSSNKVVALTECGVLPDIDLLEKSKVPWSYYMTWSKEFCLGQDYNTYERLRAMYQSSYAITLDEYRKR